MKVLFATNNPAKVRRYVPSLEEQDIEVLTLKDLNLKIDVEEIGKSAIENAIIKAKAYYDLTKITTISVDDNLYIEGLPEELQPGTNVRRVNNKRLNDDEMIEYYANLVKPYGEKLNAKWVYGMAVYDGKEIKKYSWSKSYFYLVSKPHKERNVGYPLDSISIDPRYNKYFVELTPEEKKSENDNEQNVIEFIKNSLK